MPKNTRQIIRQKFDALFGTFDRLEYHLLDIERIYREGMEEHEADYTDYINAMECAYQASLELREACQKFFDEKV